MKRQGITAAGNFIVDHVKHVEEYPRQDHLAVVRSHSRHSGGGPFNLLSNLSAMQVPYPLNAVASIGDDPDGEWIKETCKQRGIETGHIFTTSKAGTSWTDVMSVISTGRRTFFHYPGANAQLSLETLQFGDFSTRIFYLGYLTMLDALDHKDATGRTAASRVLERASDAGMLTVADLVSRDHPVLADIVASAAPYLDFLLLNELEAGWLCGSSFQGSDLTAQNLSLAAQKVLELGIRKAVVVHCEHGVVYVARSGMQIIQPALHIPAGSIRSKLGAGDAFAAGFLHGVHQENDPSDCLKFGVSVAAACLTAPSASAGVRPLKECMSMAAGFGFQTF